MSECIIWPNEEKAPVRIDDADGGEIVAIMVGSTYEGYPVFRLKGEMTLPQLRRITHLLCEVMVDGHLSAQTAAVWALNERLGKIVTGDDSQDEADDDE